jgi:tyrosyl-tRNA synthetase
MNCDTLLKAAGSETLARLTAGCKDVVSEADLQAKLARAEAEQKPLRVKLGIDASGPDIHLGFAVVLHKLRQFQDAGHLAVLVIGDFTGKIGDPSGRSKTRPQLTDEQIQANMARYREQVSKILIPERTEFTYNSQWSDPLTARQIIALAAKITLARIIEREDFKNRLSQGLPLGLHEILYPLFQAYDSVAVRADVELGGADQYWNLLVGRELQRESGQEPQVVMTMPLLEGTDGKLKMSKSYGNYVGVSEPPREIYGKLMSIPDPMIKRYFELATDWSPEQIREVESGLQRGDNPRDWKSRLARAIVARYYSAAEADQAVEEFDRVFKQHELPENMPEFVLEAGAALIDIAVSSGLAPSRSEFRRKVIEGAVYLDGDRVLDPNLAIAPGSTMILKLGKRKFLRIRPEEMTPG